MGLGLASIISVTLAAHTADSAKDLAKLFDRLPNIQEVMQTTGDMDYFVKVVTPDLKALSALISNDLLPHPAVQNVKTAVVLETIKNDAILPL